MPDTLFDSAPMNFGPMGDRRPLAHADGPSTSHEAVARHTESGKRATHCDLVEVYVRDNPGMTGRELFVNTTVHLVVDLVELRRRLTDLKNQSRIRQGKQRVCAVKRTIAVTWWHIREREAHGN